MFITLMGVLISEAINSSIERVVDLVTLEHHPMAGRAKDIGSTVVLLSIIVFIIVWVSILL
jgi:diacylglycerol kinase (ATP)